MTPAGPGGVETLVVGGTGLLGSAVVRRLEAERRSVRRVEVPWGDQPAAVAALVAAGADLLATGAPWRLAWCAGSGVVGTSQAQLDDELSSLSGFLDAFAGLVSRAGAPEGAMFLASSAGGVYAGSAAPPFTESTPERPLAPYGEAKLASERLARAFARQSGVPLLVGRIANLYGPGQDPGKAQGLVTALCRAHLTRRPTSIYVSLDTARDYLFVDDAARLVVTGLDRAAVGDAGATTVKIMASQRAATIASVLGEVRRITRQRPLVVLGASRLARFQVRDLRFRSVVWTDLDALVTTDLPAGIAATLASTRAEALRPVLVPR